MTSPGPAIRRLAKGARTALLAGCLSLLTAQQFGHGTCEVLDALLLQTGTSSAHALKTADGPTQGAALSCDRLVPICEAVLTDRKPFVRPPACHPKQPAGRPVDIFHNNCRPVVLRTRAVFCDFALLRHILHPHLAFIENASAVLC